MACGRLRVFFKGVKLVGGPPVDMYHGQSEGYGLVGRCSSPRMFFRGGEGGG